MANYNLVVDSKFQPFSFERYIAPYQMYGQAYKEVENQLADLDTKSKVWKKLANDERDKKSKAYKQYTEFQNKLDDLAEKISKEGLSLSSRKDSLAMRGEYSTVVTPIEEAYIKRAKDAELQAQNELRGIIYDTHASETSLDDYISNPTLKHAAADVNAGYKRLGDAASAISKQLRSYGPGKHIDDYTKTFLQQHGYKETEVNQAIKDIQMALKGEGNTRGNGILQSLLSQEMQTSGVNNWTNKAAIMDYYNRVSPAIYQAVGQTSVSPMDDYAARYALQHPTPTTSPMSELSHWGYLLGDTPELYGYNDLKKGLLSTLGKELSSDYIGKEKVNPMKIYEDKMEYESKHKKSYQTYKGGVDRFGPNVGMAYDDGGAEEYIKKKYGVSNIISASQYEALKNLGYNSSISTSNMSGLDINQKINEHATVYAPTSTNLSKYDWVDTRVRNTASTWNKDGASNMMYEYSKGKKGKSVSYDDIFDEKGKNKVTDVAYSLQNPGYVVMTIGGKNYLMDPTAISQEFAEVVENAKSKSSYADTNKLKSQLQDITTYKLRQLLNNYGQVRTESSSRI